MSLSDTLNGIRYILFNEHKKLGSKLAPLFSKSEHELVSIFDRVNYYCKINPSNPQKSRPNLRELLESGSKYAFDLFKTLRYFPKNLHFNLHGGDVTYECLSPSFTKTRPISQKSSNNIILKLDSQRHFDFTLPRQIPFASKKDALFFRGKCPQRSRANFLQSYFHNPFCDVANTNPNLRNLAEFTKAHASIEEHLKFKYILSLEGNDVATNLKWILKSNSIAVMPKPKYESWFMEGRLKSDVHFIKIERDFSNVVEKIKSISQKQCLEIIKNANKHASQFEDSATEELISILTLRKFFYLSGQIEVSTLERDFYK